MKSIPVVQQVYQAILADMTLNFNLLLTTLEQPTILLGSEPLPEGAVGDLNEDDAEAALIFDCSALCQIGNVKGNLFGVSDENARIRFPRRRRLTVALRTVAIPVRTVG